MNKKLNTALFFVAATVVNLTIVLVLGLAVFIPYAIFVGPHVPGQVNLLALIVVVMGSMAGSFPLYRKLIELFQKKVDVEKYFDPIVRTSGKKARR